MVEGSGHPGGRRVASLALLRKTSLSVIRVRGAVVVFCMAAVAIGGRASKLSVDVARCAGQRGVRAGQSETGEFQMVELRVEPGIHAVAGLTCRGKVQHLMIGVHSLLIIGVVTGNAGRGQAYKLTGSLAFVTLNAIHHRVRP